MARSLGPAAAPRARAHWQPEVRDACSAVLDVSDINTHRRVMNKDTGGCMNAHMRRLLSAPQPGRSRRTPRGSGGPGPTGAPYRSP
jgi:hypothetical protein